MIISFRFYFVGCQKKYMEKKNTHTIVKFLFFYIALKECHRIKKVKKDAKTTTKTYERCHNIKKRKKKVEIQNW